MRSKIAAVVLLTSIIGAPAWAKTALETVEQFYQAATSEGMCEEAMQIRPGYTLDQCLQFKSVDIRSLRILKETETEAILALRMKYTTNKTQRFNGYLHLYKESEQWKIIGSNYRSRKAMTKSQYIKTFLGTANLKADDDSKAPEPDTLSGNHREVLQRLEKQYAMNAKKHPIALIDTSEQEMYLYFKKQLKRVYPISTSIKGEGNESEQTPLGIHLIRKKFGEDAPLGTIFIDRQDTNTVAKIVRENKKLPESSITSRILWLDGLEGGKNRGGEVDTRNRLIYINGTDEEGLIGRKASQGSIRMYNKDIIKVFDKLPVGSLVYIGR